MFYSGENKTYEEIYFMFNNTLLVTLFQLLQKTAFNPVVYILLEFSV